MEHCQSILNDIIESVLDSYTITVVLRQKNPDPLCLMQAIQEQNIPHWDILSYTIGIQSYSLIQVKVHKQHISNLCGFHALFNILESVRWLKLKHAQRPWKICDPPSFWKFKFRVSEFLTQFAAVNKTSLHWSERNTRFGDLERAFLKALMAYNEHIHSHFTATPNFVPQLLVFNFQFGQIIMGSDTVDQVQGSIDFFNQCENQEVVIGYMLGITNHWAVLIAHRVGSFKEFYYLDSKNVRYINWGDQEIERYLDKRNAKRIREGKTPLTNFQRYVQTNAFKDFQYSLDLLMRCFLGFTSLHIEILKQRFNELIDTFEQIQVDNLVDKLSLFLNMGYPARHVNGDYVQFLLAVKGNQVPYDLRQKILNWANGLYKALTQMRGIPHHENLFLRMVLIPILSHLRAV